MKTTLPDGLYAVVQPKWAAGFVVEHGEVTMCAPYLRPKLGYWMRHARLIPPRVSTLNPGGRL